MYLKKENFVLDSNQSNAIFQLKKSNDKFQCTVGTE